MEAYTVYVNKVRKHLAVHVLNCYRQNTGTALAAVPDEVAPFGRAHNCSTVSTSARSRCSACTCSG